MSAPVGPEAVFAGEAREILGALTEGLLALDRGEAAAPVIGELFRRAHTLKGAARVVRLPAVAELAHLMEDVLAAHRDSGEPLTGQEIGELLRLVDALEAELAPPCAAPGAEAASVRVDLAQLDSVVEELIGIEALLAALREDGEELDGDRRRATALAGDLGTGAGSAGDAADRLGEDLSRLSRRTTARIDALEQAVRRARAHADALRLAPASEMFPALERAAGDAARELGRRVAFVARGARCGSIATSPPRRATRSSTWCATP